MTHNEASGAGTSRSRLDNVAPAPISFLRRPKPFDREAAMRAYEKEHPEALQTRMQALRSRHAGTSLKIFPSDPQRFFEAGFTEILATRMAGLPIVNAKLSVAATPFVRILIDQTQAWIGVVVTPGRSWQFLHLLLVKAGASFLPAELKKLNWLPAPSVLWHAPTIFSDTTAVFRLKVPFSSSKIWQAPKPSRRRV